VQRAGGIALAGSDSCRAICPSFTTAGREGSLYEHTRVQQCPHEGDCVLHRPSANGTLADIIERGLSRIGTVGNAAHDKRARRIPSLLGGPHHRATFHLDRQPSSITSYPSPTSSKNSRREFSQSNVLSVAAVEVASGTVEIDPSPEGATGYIADESGVIAKTFGPTSRKAPIRLAVEAGKPFRVHIELEGYEPVDQERTIQAKETLIIAPELRKAKAKLDVTTTPAGATVSLKGRLLGETPLVRGDLEPIKAAELVIAKTGYEPIKRKVQLVAGKTLAISETLKVGQKYGAARILLKGGGWGDVYYKGTLLGRAPTREPIRAPVGKQTFTLVNTGKTPSIKWTITCEVSESETNTCWTQMP